MWKNGQVIMNTWFELHPRNLNTWKSPGDTYWNQTDYITINKWFQNAVLVAKTYPGRDCGSDHNLLLHRLHVKLKKLTSKKAQPRQQLVKLKKDETLWKEYSSKVKNRNSILEKDNDSNSDITSKWKILQEAVVKSAEECIYKKEKHENQKWMKTEILYLMDKGRTVKQSDVEEYRKLDKEIKLRWNEAKDKWLNDNCEELERLEKKTFS